MKYYKRRPSKIILALIVVTLLGLGLVRFQRPKADIAGLTEFTTQLSSYNQQLYSQNSSYKLATNTTTRNLILSQMVKTSVERKNFIAGNLASDSVSFFNLNLSKGRDNFPQTVKENIEKIIEKSGRIERLTVDSQDQILNDKNLYTFKSDDKLVSQVYFAKSNYTAEGLGNINGVELDNNVIVSNFTKSQSRSNFNVQTVGTKQYVVALIDYSKDTLVPKLSRQDITDAVFNSSTSTAAFMKENSKDKFNITNGGVTDWYQASLDYYPGRVCSVPNISYAGSLALQASGITNYNSQNVIYLVNGSCVYNGLASVGGSIFAWMKTDATSTKNFVSYVVSHEMGHTLGLNHANLLDCKVGDDYKQISSSCSAYEYGDPFDVMGGGLNANFNVINSYSNAMKARLGWIENSNINTVISNGEYTLYPTEYPNGNLLMIKKGSAPVASAFEFNQAQPEFNYYLEFRRPIGFDATIDPHATTGVTIRTTGNYQDAIYGEQSNSNSIWYNYFPTYLVDTNPSNDLADNNEPLQLNNIFFDPAASIRIKTTEVTSDYAKVIICVADENCSLPRLKEVSMSYPPGWSIASSPFVGDNQTPETALGFKPPVIYSYDPTTNNYTLVGNVSNGTGYWIYNDTGTTLNKTITGEIIPDNVVSKSLNVNQWQLIANPLGQSIYPYQIQIVENGQTKLLKDSTFPYIFTYNGTQYQLVYGWDTTEIKPGQGFWYLGLTGMTEMKFDKTLTAPTSSTTRSLTQPSSSPPPPPPVPTSSSKIDLEMSNFSISPQTAVRGSNVTLTFTIKNNGSASQSNVLLNLYNSENVKLSAKPIIVPLIKPGETLVKNLVISVPLSLSRGNYPVTAKIEPVGNENISNNSKIFVEKIL